MEASMQEPWYVELFKNYARQYEKEAFTQGTIGECDFLEEELGYNKSLRILDVGCGTGRHAIELTKRGYLVTGIDLSESQLTLAKEHAAEQGLSIGFLQADARKLPFTSQFDVAIMLCEGGFPLMETDEENKAIICSVARALTDEALFIFTTLNGLFPLQNSLHEFYQETGKPEQASYDSFQFDFLTMRDHNVTAFIDDDQQEHTVISNERYYIPSEISTLLQGFGFDQVDFLGAKLGAFSRADALTEKDFEMLVVARRKLSNNILISQYTASINNQNLQRSYRLIMDTFSKLQRKLKQSEPQNIISQIYQGFLDMSYIAVMTPLLQRHNLKLAVVYIHETGCFEAWLAAKNRTIQEQYRAKLRTRVQEPYRLKEQKAGEDAILTTMLNDDPDFSDPTLLVLELKKSLDQVLEDMHSLLGSRED